MDLTFMTSEELDKLNKKYLVQYKWYGSEEIEYFLETTDEIIRMIDISDSNFDYKFKIYDASEYGNIKPLVIHGCWHDPDNPLYIKVTDEDGNLVFDGYGTD